MQAPMLARLPPGLTFSDDGSLAGTVRFDPHRGSSSYRVNFVAVSAAGWRDEDVGGLVRLQLRFTVHGNEPPPPRPQPPQSQPPSSTSHTSPAPP